MARTTALRLDRRTLGRLRRRLRAHRDLHPRTMNFDDLPIPPSYGFGVWDAPMTDDATWLDAPPPGLACLYCGEAFKPDDNGGIICGTPQHRECGLRVVMGGIGHHVNHAKYCRSELGP